MVVDGSDAGAARNLHIRVCKRSASIGGALSETPQNDEWAAAMKAPGDDGRVASLECLDQRLELHAKRFVVWRYGRDFAVYTK